MLKWLAAAVVAFVCSPVFADDGDCLIRSHGRCYIHGDSLGVTKGDFTLKIETADGSTFSTSHISGYECLSLLDDALKAHPKSAQCTKAGNTGIVTQGQTGNNFMTIIEGQ